MMDAAIENPLVSENFSEQTSKVLAVRSFEVETSITEAVQW